MWKRLSCSPLAFRSSPCFSIRLNLDFEDFRLNFLSIVFQTNEGAVFLSENPMFEICSNGFSHFKLSQNGCKSSSLVNEHENVKIEFQIPVGRVFFFFIKIDNIKSLKKIFLLRINWASAPHPLALKKEFRGNVRWYFVRAVTLIVVNYHFHIKELTLCIDLW